MRRICSQVSLDPLWRHLGKGASFWGGIWKREKGVFPLISRHRWIAYGCKGFCCGNSPELSPLFYSILFLHWYQLFRFSIKRWESSGILRRETKRGFTASFNAPPKRKKAYWKPPSVVRDILLYPITVGTKLSAQNKWPLKANGFLPLAAHNHPFNCHNNSQSLSRTKELLSDRAPGVAWGPADWELIFPTHPCTFPKSHPFLFLY